MVSYNETVLKWFGIKLTKEGLQGVIKKAIPVIGGVISGGITYFGLNDSGERLRKRLSEITYDYTYEKAKKDFERYQKIAREYTENELEDNMENIQQSK